MLKVSKILTYNSNFFTLKIRQTRKATAITMQVSVPLVNTRDIPQTLEYMKENFPTVLRTKCYNDQNLPFSVEVKETEIGHLFEHILIDSLCDLKIKNGAKSAVFSGNTSWNWRRDPYGLFQIWIDIGKREFALFIEALKKTIKATEELMEPVFYALTHISPAKAHSISLQAFN